jgi:hypothetical protein
MLADIERFFFGQIRYGDLVSLAKSMVVKGHADAKLSSCKN